MIKFLSILLLFSSISSFAQEKGDYQWIFGYSSENPNIDGAVLDFNTNPPSVIHVLKNNAHDVVNTSLCDSTGALFLYSNGCRIYNKQHQKLLNSDSISSGFILKNYCNRRSPLTQGGLILPLPGSDSVFYLFNLSLEDVFMDDTTHFPLAPLYLMYSVVHYRLGATNGKVVLKKAIALSDTLSKAGISAVRHGNGRDWWILMPQLESNCFHKLLLSPGGIRYIGQQCIGRVWHQLDLNSQCAFSPSGDKYLRHAPYDGLAIYDFDRCSGELSKPFELTFSGGLYAYAGVVVSPNGRFVYATKGNEVWQFDLWASNISESRELVGETDESFKDPFFDRYFLAQLGPDNKIYIAGSGNFNYLHVIHQPDRGKSSCLLERHAVSLYAFSSDGMPTFPNFRLGALKESPCDTLKAVSVGDLPVEVEIGGIQVVPNPAQGTFKVLVPKTSGGMLVLVDVAGRPVLRRSFAPGESAWSVTEKLQVGLYQVVVRFSDGTGARTKVVVTP